MNIVVSHPTGNRNVRAILDSFYNNKVLTEFETTINIHPQDFFVRFLPSKVKSEFLRRHFKIELQKIHTHSQYELLRMLFIKLGFTYFTQHEKGWFSVDHTYKNFDRAVSKRLSVLHKKNFITAVYAYEDGALSTFKKAKELGITCIYDLPIAYWETVRRLLTEEGERLPHWKQTLGGGIFDSQEKLERKTQELLLADIVVTPGSFVADSLPQWAQGKSVIQAYFGSPDDQHQTKEENYQSNQPLRVLFVGSMGQRKGLGDLFAAVKMLNRQDVELVVMGTPLQSMGFYKNELPNFTYESGRPHAEVLSLMRTCDVFCLPSIVEGRALVMQEAMSQGLPILITPNTGGADLVIKGQTGFLIPIRSPEDIAQKIGWFADHRMDTIDMGKKAREHARSYSWEQYGQTVIDGIKTFLES